MTYDTTSLVSIVQAEVGCEVSAAWRIADVAWCRRVTEGQRAVRRITRGSLETSVKSVGQTEETAENVKVRSFRIDSTSA